MVALFTRALIEMIKLDTPLMFKKVALFTRAWIEIELTKRYEDRITSPSSRGRGLKYGKRKDNGEWVGRPLHEGVD